MENQTDIILNQLTFAEFNPLTKTIKNKMENEPPKQELFRFVPITEALPRLENDNYYNFKYKGKEYRGQFKLLSKTFEPVAGYFDMVNGDDIFTDEVEEILLPVVSDESEQQDEIHTKEDMKNFASKMILTFDKDRSKGIDSEYDDFMKNDYFKEAVNNAEKRIVIPAILSPTPLSKKDDKAESGLSIHIRKHGNKKTFCGICVKDEGVSFVSSGLVHSVKSESVCKNCLSLQPLSKLGDNDRGGEMDEKQYCSHCGKQSCIGQECLDN
jgi:hypothetical protein